MSSTLEVQATLSFLALEMQHQNKTSVHKYLPAPTATPNYKKIIVLLLLLAVWEGGGGSFSNPHSLETVTTRMHELFLDLTDN